MVVPDFRRSGKGNIRHRLDDNIMLIMITDLHTAIIIYPIRHKPGKGDYALNE